MTMIPMKGERFRACKPNAVSIFGRILTVADALLGGYGHTQ
jgi:hypothetical protein